MRHRAQRILVALSWLLLLMLLVALGAWLYARFEQPPSLPESAALTEAFPPQPGVDRQSAGGLTGVLPSSP